MNMRAQRPGCCLPPADSPIPSQVEAEANTDSAQLPGFVPRKGAGLRLFGKSSTYPPPGPVRIYFFEFHDQHCCG